MEQKESFVEDKKINSKDEKINESEELIQICSRLDDITVTFFEILTKIFSCRKNIDSALTDGYIRMAKVTRLVINVVPVVPGHHHHRHLFLKRTFLSC